MDAPGGTGDGGDASDRRDRGDRRDTGAVADRGLQAERTRLSWSRTALAAAALGGLLLHAGTTAGHGPAGYVPGALVLLCAAAFHVCGVRRYRAVYRALRAGRPVAGPRTVRVAGLLAVGPGLLALGGALGRLLG